MDSLKCLLLVAVVCCWTREATAGGCPISTVTIPPNLPSPPTTPGPPSPAISECVISPSGKVQLTAEIFGAPGPRGLVGSSAGQKGEPGDPGPEGASGAPGSKGRPGKRGRRGTGEETGAPGFPGPPGVTGVEVPRGLMGKPGVDGERGLQVYCKKTCGNCNSTAIGWTGVTDILLPNLPSYPYAIKTLITATGDRLRVTPTVAGCASTALSPPFGINYTEVCGWAIGYSTGTPDGMAAVATNSTIDSP